MYVLPTCSRSPCEKQLSGCFAISPWAETLRPWPHGLSGTDTAGVGGLYSNLDHTLEIATPGASLSTLWNGPCYNTMNVRSGCSLVQEPPAWEDGSLLPLGQTPAGHAELPVNLGHLMRNQIRFICSLAGLQDVELF